MVDPSPGFPPRAAFTICFVDEDPQSRTRCVVCIGKSRLRPIWGPSAAAERIVWSASTITASAARSPRGFRRRLERRGSRSGCASAVKPIGELAFAESFVWYVKADQKSMLFHHPVDLDRGVQRRRPAPSITASHVSAQVINFGGSSARRAFDDLAAFHHPRRRARVRTVPSSSSLWQAGGSPVSRPDAS